MKKLMLVFAMLLSVIAASAKNIKIVVFTTNPIMHCESCENKIKGNLRFVKGVKEIETNVEKQRVTVKFDEDKTNVYKLQKAFSKFGYEASIVEIYGKNTTCHETNNDSDEPKACCGKKKDDCGEKKGDCGEKKDGCSEKKDNSGEQKSCCGEQKSCCGGM